jgi:hypothetical protein
MAGATGFHSNPLLWLNFVGFFRWWADSHLFKKPEPSEAQIATFEKLIAPWLRPLENAVYPPVGLSIFTVLEKRATQ